MIDRQSDGEGSGLYGGCMNIFLTSTGYPKVHVVCIVMPFLFISSSLFFLINGLLQSS